MKKFIFFKVFIFTILALYAYVAPPFLSQSIAKGVKTSYKRYSIFKYKNKDILCEPYIVHKDDWLYKIFKKKGEISEEDFPYFIIIFKEINPQISNIDAIEPGSHILIPLKNIKQKDYDQTLSGNIDIPVIEFSTISEDLNLTSFIQKYKIKKGDTISTLIDKEFLKKGGALSAEGLKAFQLANPNIKNINIIFEGSEVYLPDPSIKSQPWFQSLLSGKPDKKGKKELTAKQYKIEAYKLAQLRKYASLIGGTLLSSGKMYFPGEDSSGQVLDLSSTPIIETHDGSKILMISGENVNEELLEHIQNYWKNLKTQLISETINKLKHKSKAAPKKNIIAEYKQMIEALLSQAGYDYIPNAKIPFTLNNITLEASFGRILKKDTTDLLINFGNVYGTVLEILKNRGFKIITITPKLTPIELADKLFSHLGYTTWANPSFSTGEAIEGMNGLYAAKGKDTVFIPFQPLSNAAMDYLKKEKIKILTIKSLTDI